MLLVPLSLQSGRHLHDNAFPPTDPNVNDIWLSPENEFWFWDGVRWLSSQRCATPPIHALDSSIGATFQKDPLNIPIVIVCLGDRDVYLTRVSLSGRNQGNHDPDNYYKFQMSVNGMDLGFPFESKNYTTRQNYPDFQDRLVLSCDLSPTECKTASMIVSQIGEPGLASGILSIEYRLVYTDHV